METFSFTGTFGDDEAIIDVCLFEGAAYGSHYLFPFGEEHTVINHWRAGDIMDIIVEEGLLTKEERSLSKITSVSVYRFYSIVGGVKPTGPPRWLLVNEYTVHLEIMTSYISAGRNLKIEDMDQKIRNIKLKRILG